MSLHTSPLQKWWPAPLRLFLGIAFIYHGAPKLFSEAGHQGLAGTLSHLGMPLPDLLAWVVGIVEFVGGIALLLGVAVSISAAVLFVEMVVAMVKVHLPHGFSFVQVVGTGPNGPIFGLPGAEVNLVYMAALLALLIGGPGPLSIEAWHLHRREKSHPSLPSEAHA